MTEKAKKTPAKSRPAGGGGGVWPRWVRSPLFLSLLLALVTLAIYLPVARNQFVNYDDSDYVTMNPHVQGGLTKDNIVWAFTKSHSSNWHPLTWMSHMLDCDLFGAKPAGPHLVNVVFHTANTVLLFLLLFQMTRAPRRSAMVAALFALHPMHVESVAWVSERKDVLSTLFFLLTLLAYVKYARSAPGAGRGNWWMLYALALVFFALGLMSKPMLVTLPFVLLLLDYWPLRRLGLVEKRNWGRLIIEKIPFFALVVISSVVTFIVQKKGGAVSTSLGLAARISNAVVSYVRYLGKLLVPTDLSVLYPYPDHWAGTVVAGCAILLLAISVAVFWFGRRRPYLMVGWLWYLGTLVPVIGLVQVGIQSMADRYTYIPAIGLFIMVVWLIADLVGEAMPAEQGTPSVQPLPQGALTVGAIAVLAVCSWLTVRQIQVWRNSETLFTQAIHATERNYLAYNNLGYYLSNEGRVPEAMVYYKKSLEINPNYEDALNNLGYGYAGQRNFAEAIRLYESALRVRPRHPEVNNNLGNALAELGRVDEAIAHYAVTLEQKPEHADAHNNLGIALAMKGKLEEAIPHFHLAIRYKPDNASAHSNLGNALAAQHKLTEAIAEYQETLRLKPNDAHAHNNLGNVFAEQNKLPEAIAQYREALRLNADNPEAEYNLGQALVRANQRDEAVAHLREALRLKPDYAGARQQLEALLSAGAK